MEPVLPLAAIGPELMGAAALVAANGFFVATEFSITRLRPTQVDEFERKNRPGAKSARHAVENIDAYLAACQLGITISSLGLGALGEPAFHELLEPLLGDGAVFVGWGLAGIVAFLIITVLHVVVGELSPKSLALSRTAGVSLALSPLMRAFYFVTKPLVDLFNGLGNLLLKPFGVPPAREAGHAPHTEDELRDLLRESSREGLIDREEQRYAENVLLFGDRRAREVMVPRPDIDVVEVEAGVDGAIEAALRTGHTRLPLVSRGAGLEAAEGVLHAKDLLGQKPDGDLRRLARPLARVPESMLLDELLRALRRQRIHIALVLDEHGTAVGIVTMEDILEELVGEIEDEFDPEEEQHIRREDGSIVVDGEASLRAVEEELGLRVDEPHEATVGGHVLQLLGRPPREGEVVELGDAWRAEVLDVGEASVGRLRITQPADAGPPEKEEPAADA